MKILVKDLEPNMMGIYKITFPNQKIYIGKSIDIKRRMFEHNSISANKTPCDNAVNKYGKIIEIEILEFINNIAELNEREKYWIQYYNSTDRRIGYNISAGGENDGFNKAIFTKEQVIDIRKRRFYGERKKDVYKDYNHFSFASFENIWLGRGYNNIGTQYLIKPHSKSRQLYSSEANDGLKNGRAKCSREEILIIRNRYDNGETFASISKDFPNISASTIRRIALRESYKNVN